MTNANTFLSERILVICILAEQVGAAITVVRFESRNIIFHDWKESLSLFLSAPPGRDIISIIPQQRPPK
jgi:hypothetical protein